MSGATSDAVYMAGEALTLKAVPAEGYSFAGWSDGVSDSVRTVTLTGDLTLQGKFEKLLSLIEPSVQGGAGWAPRQAPFAEYCNYCDRSAGSLAISLAVGVMMRKPPPPPHPRVDKRYHTDANICQDHNLSLSASDGGSVIGSKSGTYAEGTAVTVKAEPAVGYQFVQWSDGAKAAERTIKMEKDTMLSAQFSKNM